MARTGRRPGVSGTREAILDAARRAFAEQGYQRATIRDVARLAGVELPGGDDGPRGADTGTVAVGDALAASGPCRGGRSVRLGGRRLPGGPR